MSKEYLLMGLLSLTFIMLSVLRMYGNLMNYSAQLFVLFFWCMTFLLIVVQMITLGVSRITNKLQLYLSTQSKTHK